MKMLILQEKIKEEKKIYGGRAIQELDYLGMEECVEKAHKTLCPFIRT